MSACRLLLVAGARPNFMKIAPLLAALDGDPAFSSFLLHTGQHYDDDMSASFFADLGIREPDLNLGVGSGPHGRQTGRLMIALEGVLQRREADLVVVVGDVNSTVAAALVAAKRGVPVAHVEAGLRSGDWSMPEEVNRVVTDQLSELLLTPSREAGENLRREGARPERVHFVGNIMIDSLLANLEWAGPGGGPGGSESAGGPGGGPGAAGGLGALGLEAGGYALVTLHRPSNVDDREQLAEILGALEEIAGERPVVFPVHPRTRARMREFGLDLWSGAGRGSGSGSAVGPGSSVDSGSTAGGQVGERGLRLLDPVSYLEMLALQLDAAVVLTDSGGIQEETTVLGVPCLTLRDTTERPITITEGTNRLVPVRSREKILEAYREAEGRNGRPGRPEGWDGKAAERIVEVFRRWWRERSSGASHNEALHLTPRFARRR